jgi:hypothetical protein
MTMREAKRWACRNAARMLRGLEIEAPPESVKLRADDKFKAQQAAEALIAELEERGREPVKIGEGNGDGQQSD